MTLRQKFLLYRCKVILSVQVAEHFCNRIGENGFRIVAVNIQTFGTEKSNVANSEKRGKKCPDIVENEVVIPDISPGSCQENNLFYIGQAARYA